ncbi:MAG: GNAT family N-acetyltransferase [Candidatus Dormibacteraeota bacterium]|nr:GNAT family N-acetyltransferase [Candidatus Dormibacteraeota bacterium]
MNALEDPIQELTPLASSDAPDVLGLLNRELGEPLYGMDDLEKAAADPTATVNFIRHDGGLAAAAIARVLVPEDADYYRPFGSPVEDLFTGHTVGSLEALAVRPSDRRRGLGARLVRARLAWLAEHGCDRVVAVSWLSGRAGTSAPLYRRLGFKEGDIAINFYLEESRTDGWSCPVCGNPCRCSAQLFWFEQEATPQVTPAPSESGPSETIPAMNPPRSEQVDPDQRSGQAPGEEVVQVNDPYRGGGPAPEEEHGKEDLQHPTGG